MSTSSVYETLLTRVWVVKLEEDGTNSHKKVDGYEFEPPTRGLPYSVYLSGGQVFRTSHVEEVRAVNGGFVLKTRNSLYRVAYPQVDPEQGTGDAHPLGALRPAVAMRNERITRTEEICSRRIRLSRVWPPGRDAGQQEVMGWEAAPPQEGEPYLVYVETGGIFLTPTLQEVQTADTAVVIRTENAVYRIEYAEAPEGAEARSTSAGPC
jgi:hypothetical protein